MAAISSSMWNGVGAQSARRLFCDMRWYRNCPNHAQDGTRLERWIERFHVRGCPRRGTCTALVKGDNEMGVSDYGS